MTWKIEIDSDDCEFRSTVHIGGDHRTPMDIRVDCLNDTIGLPECKKENCPIRSTGWPEMQTGEPEEEGFYLVKFKGYDIPHPTKWDGTEWEWWEEAEGYWHLPGGEK
jgi:hypothetical protein